MFLGASGRPLARIQIEGRGVEGLVDNGSRTPVQQRIAAAMLIDDIARDPSEDPVKNVHRNIFSDLRVQLSGFPCGDQLVWSHGDGRESASGGAFMIMGRFYNHSYSSLRKEE